MTKSAEQLILALTKEYELYKEYLALAKEKKQAIIQANMKELERITKIEQNWIIHMGKMDEIRRAIIGNILHERQVASVQNITELTSLLDEPVKTKVLEIKEQFEKLLREIKDIHDLNSKLIQQGLDYIDFHLNVLTRAETKGSFYNHKADEKDSNQRTTLFDAKI